MGVELSQLVADREREFLDWGEPVTLRRVVQSFDPASQTIDSAIEEFPVTAILGSLATRGIEDAGGQARCLDLIARMRSEEFPASPAGTVWRLVHLGAEFDVVEQAVSGCGLVRELICRKVG